jgi:hypothetical protein
MLPFALLVALVWGVCVALAIRFTWLGRFVAEHLTWLSVVVGSGGNLLILLLLTDDSWRVAWWQVVAVFALSGLPLCAQGVYELSLYFKGLMDDAKNPSAE